MHKDQPLPFETVDVWLSCVFDYNETAVCFNINGNLKRNNNIFDKQTIENAATCQKWPSMFFKTIPQGYRHIQ